MSDTLSPSRLEAFSDGVIAVVITIMVLELNVPQRNIGNLEGLRHELPLLSVYLLSFIQTGIYWVNHHYLLDDLKQVTHGILWANLALLFSLSLIPWATRWVGERGITPFSTALYCTVFQLPAIAWIVLASLILKRTQTKLANGRDLQIFSAVMTLVAIGMAYVSPYIALAMIAFVAFRWMVTPKLIRVKTQTAPRQNV